MVFTRGVAAIEVFDSSSCIFPGYVLLGTLQRGRANQQSENGRREVELFGRVAEGEKTASAVEREIHAAPC